MPLVTGAGTNLGKVGGLKSPRNTVHETIFNQPQLTMTWWGISFLKGTGLGY